MNANVLKKVLPGVALIALGALVYSQWLNFEHRSATAVSGPPPVIRSDGGLPDFSAIAKAFGPAVVNITVTSGHGARIARNFNLDPGDPMFEFFRHFGMPVPRDDAPSMGQGSGFIVGADGVILTNAHVVANAAEVTVKLTDKRELHAKVLGMDKPSDVAVLKIDAKSLPTVRLGDSAILSVGEWVLAIGSPFGFENSVTAGIVSAKSRTLPDENYVPFIQTDVAVNPGNSGGPLFNMRGEVVGINSQIYSRSGGYQGLSFAIPIEVAMKVEEQILKHGKVVRGRIGAAVQEMSQDLAESFGLKAPDGALVASVESNSPADKAGLQAGDVILAVNGELIKSSGDLPPKIAALRPGTTATLEIWRGRQKRKLDISIGELTETVALSDTGGSEHGRLGVAVRPLNADERRQLHVDGGLLVEEASGPAAKAGIRPGDIIVAVNGDTVASVEQLRRLAEKAGHRLALLVQRDGSKLYIPVTPG